MSDYARLYRIAVREAERIELGRAIRKVDDATHAVVSEREPDRVYCYGSLRTCEEFTRTLERARVVVVKMSAEMKEQETAHLIRVWRNP